MSRPYFSVYSDIRERLRTISDDALRIWMLLGTFIDSQGRCYPGVKALAILTGYRAERVQAALDELESCGWLRYLRKGQRDPMTGHYVANIYELHHQLVHVRGPLAEALSDSASLTQSRNPPIPRLAETPEHNQHQIQNHSTSTSDPESVNHHQQTNASLKNGDGATDGSALPPIPPLAPIAPLAADETQPADQNGTAGQTRRSRQPAPNGATPLSPLPPSPAREAESLAPYANPLDDAEAEALVDLVHTTVGSMTVPNARRLVVRYGQKNVRAALKVLGAQDEIRNPAGFFRWLIERWAVDPERDANMQAPLPGAGDDWSKFSDFLAGN